MKKLVILSVLLAISQLGFAQQDAFLKDYLERWETSRKYLIDVAEAMPESEYSFKPTPDVKSFQEQLVHIATAMDWHANEWISGGSRKYSEEYRKNKAPKLSKAEAIALTNQMLIDVGKLVANFDPARYEDKLKYNTYFRTKRQALMLMADHVTHHRAEMLIYLRLKGIVPPKYVDFQ